MSDKLKKMFGDSGMTPKQEKKFFEKIAKDENEIIKALENKNKLKGSKDNIGMMGGGYMKKNMMGGGYMKKNMAKGGSLEMVEKNGKKVPFYAADGVGKMAKGGQVYKRGHGGKVIKNNMSGEDLVKKCYDN